jgi:hypothetical protein
MRFSLFLVALYGMQAQVSFVRDVYPVLEKAGCRGCHTVEGVGSTTRLQFPEEDASEVELRAFGESLRRFLNAKAPEKSLLVQKPTNRVAHAGGKRIEPGSEAEKALLQWLKEMALRPAEKIEVADRPAPPESRRVLRRLTHSQYDNTVRDLLGDATAPSRQVPPEDFVDGFKNQIEAQSITPLLAEAYAAASERLASRYNPPPCQGAQCLAEFVRDFGKRAFRRPLTGEELKRYGQLAKQASGYEEGARLVVEAMLQSPSFLYRMESAPEPETRYARASTLSYLLWDTMPDDWLMDRAEGGVLDTPEGYTDTVRRMLKDKRARQALDEYVSQWMRLDRVLTMVKERASYPMFTRELAVAMAEETRRFVAHLVWSERNFMEFFTAGYSFVNADLANIYGMPAPAEEFSQVEYPPESERAGILGQATFLALTSKPADTSPTARGLFVREQFLCQHVPQPPPGTNTNLPPQRADRPLTNRERVAIHLSNPGCASCHNLIDPIGFALEKFDAVGQRREKAVITIRPDDRREERKKVELALDVSGYIAGIRDSEFQSPRELGTILARTPQCQDCIARQYFRYAMGRKETPTDRPILDKIFSDFRNSQFRFTELMVAVARWTEFPSAP